jgi:hypothetical protein
MKPFLQAKINGFFPLFSEKFEYSLTVEIPAQSWKKILTFYFFVFVGSKDVTCFHIYFGVEIHKFLNDFISL